MIAYSHCVEIGRIRDDRGREIFCYSVISLFIVYRIFQVYVYIFGVIYCNI